MYRILGIRSYIYHSDVIAVATLVNDNEYKVNRNLLLQGLLYQTYYKMQCDPQSLTDMVYNVDMWSSRQEC